MDAPPPVRGKLKDIERERINTEYCVKVEVFTLRCSDPRVAQHTLMAAGNPPGAAVFTLCGL